MKRIVLFIFVLTAIVVAVSTHARSQQVKKQNNKPSSFVPIDTVALSRDSLSRLKAVLVVGPVEKNTQRFIDEAKSIATYLKGLGVHVTEFYHPNTSWTDIIRASEGAHIFIYSGHGTDLGEHGKSGGFCLSDSSVSSYSILKGLKLYKNALVIFHQVCMAAGSSAEDTTDIGIKTATQRISDYAHPFIKLGAAGYYANNTFGSITIFLRAFFNKKSIKQIFKENISDPSQIETTQKYMYDPKFEISVVSYKLFGFSTITTTTTTFINGVKKEVEEVKKVPIVKNYGPAFVSIPCFTVLDFFK